jgi:RecJ-like exonuclease
MSCQCNLCGHCNGTGTVWLSFRDTVPHARRTDDLDEPEPCNVCEGTGVFSLCLSCEKLERNEMDLLWSIS